MWYFSKWLKEVSMCVTLEGEHFPTFPIFQKFSRACPIVAHYRNHCYGHYWSIFWFYGVSNESPSSTDSTSRCTVPFFLVDLDVNDLLWYCSSLLQEVSLSQPKVKAIHPNSSPLATIYASEIPIYFAFHRVAIGAKLPVVGLGIDRARVYHVLISIH